MVLSQESTDGGVTEGDKRQLNGSHNGEGNILTTSVCVCVCSGFSGSMTEECLHLHSGRLHCQNTHHHVDK